MADRAYCLIGGQVAMSGSPGEVYRHPNTLDVALLTGDAFLLPIAGAASEMDQAAEHLIVRPEWLSIVPQGTHAQWEGMVESLLFQGDHYLITFHTGHAEGQIRSASPVRIGQKIGIAIARGITPTRLSTDHPSTLGNV
jgi:ABC-type Fe3+/spermidine/putrescine transport system ATPase subunit